MGNVASSPVDSAAGLDWGPVQGERTVTPSSKACSHLLSPSSSEQRGKPGCRGPHFACERAERVTPEGGSVLSWPCWAPGSALQLPSLMWGNRPQDVMRLCYGGIQGKASSSFGDFPLRPVPSPQNWPWPHLPPGLEAPLPLHPPGLSILRPWSSVPQGLFLHWWSWLVMAMKCCLLALGSSSLEGGMGPVWLMGVTQ